MAKQQRRKRARKKKIRYNRASGQIRTVSVETEEWEPFSITFEVPGAAWLIEATCLLADGETDGAKASRGELVIKFIGAHLKGWSLDPEPTEAGVRALADPEIVFEIFSAIREAGESAKN